MKQKHQKRVKGRVAKSALRLPELEIAKAAGLPPRHRRIRGLVLFRTATVLQQDSCRPLSNAPEFEPNELETHRHVFGHPKGSAKIQVALSTHCTAP